MRYSADNKIGIHGLVGPTQQEKGQVTVTVTVTFAHAALFPSQRPPQDTMARDQVSESRARVWGPFAL